MHAEKAIAFEGVSVKDIQEQLLNLKRDLATHEANANGCRGAIQILERLLINAAKKAMEKMDEAEGPESDSNGSAPANRIGPHKID